MKIDTLTTIFVLLAVSTLLAGCSLNPSIVSAHSEKLVGHTSVEVLLRQDDAYAIKERQLYFSIVLVDCANSDNQFPAEAYIQGKRASDFSFSTAETYVGFNAEVPDTIFDQYQNPCVFLRGGSYFRGKIRTDAVPLVAR